MGLDVLLDEVQTFPQLGLQLLGVQLALALQDAQGGNQLSPASTQFLTAISSRALCLCSSIFSRSCSCCCRRSSSCRRILALERDSVR